MKTYAVTMADGSVEITTIYAEKMTITDVIAKWHPSKAANVVSHVEIDPAVIPADRTFRDAWKLNGKRIEADVPRAKELLLTRQRRTTPEHQAAIRAASTPADLKALLSRKSG